MIFTHKQETQKNAEKRRTNNPKKFIISTGIIVVYSTGTATLVVVVVGLSQAYSTCTA